MTNMVLDRKWHFVLSAILIVCVAIGLTCLRERIELENVASLFSVHDERELLDFMCKSQYWRVSQAGDDIQASLRYDLLKPTLSVGDSRGAVCFSFSDGKEGAGLRDGAVKVSPKGNQKVSLRLGLNDGFESTLNLAFANGTFLTIYESGWRRERRVTNRILDYFGQIASSDDLALLLAAENSVCHDGQTNMVSHFSVENSNSPAVHGHVSCWMNPRVAGTVEILVRDPKSGEVLNAGKGHRTSEFVGWDRNAANKFYFESELCVDGNGEVRDVTIELVFTPLRQGMRRTVFSANATVRTWVK